MPQTHTITPDARHGPGRLTQGEYLRRWHVLLAAIADLREAIDDFTDLPASGYDPVPGVPLTEFVWAQQDAAGFRWAVERALQAMISSAPPQYVTAFGHVLPVDEDTDAAVLVGYADDQEGGGL